MRSGGTLDILTFAVMEKMLRLSCFPATDFDNCKCRLTARLLLQNLNGNPGNSHCVCSHSYSQLYRQMKSVDVVS